MELVRFGAVWCVGVSIESQVYFSMRREEVKQVEQSSDSPQLLKAFEVAKILGLGRTKVYEMMAGGQLPVVKIGTAVRVPRKRLLAWIEENTQEAA
jgi:excisionase family DNA binding protein